MPKDVATEKEFMCNRCTDWAVVLRPESAKSAVYEPLCKKHADLTVFNGRDKVKP